MKHLLLAAAFLPAAAFAQENPDAPHDGPPPGGPKGGRHRPPPPPILLIVLDTDKDGILSAAEIQAAPESLKKLDKNGDGQLGPRELAPPPPERSKNKPSEDEPESKSSN